MAGISYTNILLAVLFAAGIAYLSFKHKFLTNSGIISSCIFAIVLFGFGSWKWSIPIVTFFFTSSVLTNIRNRTNKISDEKITPLGRDYLQVLSNGIIPLSLFIIYIFTEIEILYLLFCSSVAAVTADTWGTEMGGLRQNSTVLIISFKKVEQGTSGGVSIMGTLASLLGAFILGLVSLIWIKNNILDFLIIITLSGFFGSLVDSILGATMQVKYVCSICGKSIELKEHCNTASEKVKGLGFVDNNFVNLAASFSGCLFSYFFWIIK